MVAPVTRSTTLSTFCMRSTPAMPWIRWTSRWHHVAIPSMKRFSGHRLSFIGSPQRKILPNYFHMRSLYGRNIWGVYNWNHLERLSRCDHGFLCNLSQFSKFVEELRFLFPDLVSHTGYWRVLFHAKPPLSSIPRHSSPSVSLRTLTPGWCW